MVKHRRATRARIKVKVAEAWANSEFGTKRYKRRCIEKCISFSATIFSLEVPFTVVLYERLDDLLPLFTIIGAPAQKLPGPLRQRRRSRGVRVGISRVWCAP